MTTSENASSPDLPVFLFAIWKFPGSLKVSKADPKERSSSSHDMINVISCCADTWEVICC